MFGDGSLLPYQVIFLSRTDGSVRIVHFEQLELAEKFQSWLKVVKNAQGHIPKDTDSDDWTAEWWEEGWWMD